MADVLTLRTVFTADSTHLRETMARDDKAIDEFIAKKRENIKIGVTVTGADGLPQVERGVDATQRRIEASERTSQQRRNNIAAEGEARRAALESQGAQRRISIELETTARIEGAQRESLARQARSYEQHLSHISQLRQRGARLSETGSTIAQTGGALTMGVTAPLAAGGALVAREGIRFEQNFADARKTLDGTFTQIERIRGQIREMAAGKNPIPIDVNELSKIAASAGELGVRTPGVAEFVATMARLGTATNLSSDQAATGLARIDNIMATGQKSFDRYGAALVDLGNHGASTESEIVAMSLRLAAAAKQVGISAPQVLAYGSALASMGVEAEAGGTSFSKTWKDIDAAVRKGGEELALVAKVSGTSASQFKRAWGQDAAGATLSFVQGLGKIGAAGGSVADTLDKLGIKESRQQDAITRLAGGTDVLAQSLRTSGQAWQSNSALTEEANKKYQTTASQIQILQNRLRELALRGNDILLPGLNREIKALSDGLPDAANAAVAAYTALGEGGRKAAIGLLAVGAGAGPTLKVAGSALEAVGAYQKLIGTIREAREAKALADGAGAVAGAGALAGSGSAAAGLLASPVTWAVLAAAIAGGLVLLTKFRDEYHDVLLKNQQLHDASEKLDGAFKRALSGTSDNKLRTQLEHLQTEAQEAKGDVEKLRKVLQETRDTDVHIKKLGLAPHAEIPLRNELRDIIASLETQLSINLKVNTGQGSGGSNPSLVPPKYSVSTGNASWRPMTTREQLKAMASAAGLVIEAPAMTSESALGPVPIPGAQDKMAKFRQAQARGLALPPELKDPREGLYWFQSPDPKEVARYEQGKKAYEAQLEAIRKKLAPLAQAGEKQTEVLSHGSYWARLDNGLKKYHDNLQNLMALQKVFDDAVKGGYRPSRDESNAVRAVGDRVSELQGAEHAKRNHDLYVANREKAAREAESQQKAKDRAEELKRRAESLADQARSDRGQDLGQQLNHWNQFGNQVEGILSGIAQSGERTGAGTLDNFNRQLAEAKTRAQLARDEFDGIPRPLKESLINLAGINAELQKIVSVRDALRGTFGEIYNRSDGADKARIAEFARDFERSLGLEKRANELIRAGRERGAGLLGTVAGQKDTLQSAIRANQLAGRKGFDDPNNPDDGVPGGVVTAQMVRDAATIAKVPAKISACANVAAQMLESFGVTIPGMVRVSEKGVKTYESNVATMETLLKRAHVPTVPLSQARAGDTLIWDTDKSRRYGEGRSYGAVSGKHMEIAEGNGRTSGNRGGVGRGNPRSLGSGISDPNAVTVYRTSALAMGAAPVPVPTAKPGEMPISTARFPSPSQVQAPKPKPTVPTDTATVKRDVSDTLDPISLYQSVADTLKNLPAGWGEPMSQHRTRAGEQTGNRQAFEQLLAQLVAQGVKVPDAAAKRARSFMNDLDFKDSTRLAGDEAARALNDLGARVRLAGKENNPYLALLEEFNSGAARFTSSHGKSALLKMTLGLMRADMDAATREGTYQSGNAVKMATENAALFGTQGFDRAQFATQKRFEIWNSADITALSQAIAKLKESGAAFEAEGQQKFLNGVATRRLSDALREYDAQAAQTAQKGSADRLTAMREEAALMSYQLKLMGDMTLSQNQRDAQFAAERERRQAAKELEPSRIQPGGEGYRPGTGAGSILNQYAIGRRSDATVNGQIAERGEAAGKGVTDEQTGRADAANQSEANRFTDRLAALREQLGRTRQYRADDPQLNIETTLSQFREQLLSGELSAGVSRGADGSRVVDTATEAELKKRLTSKRQELEVERDIQQIQEQQSAALRASNSLLDTRKEGELLLARTARERLEIEWRYQDAQRKDGGPSDSELRDREAISKQTGENEQVNQVKRSAGEMSRVLSNSIYTGMKDGAGKGVRSLLETLKDEMLRNAAEGLAGNLTNRMFRGRAGVDADGKPRDVIQSEPDWMGTIFGNHRKTPLSVPIAPTLAPRFSVAPHRSSVVTSIMANAAQYAGVGQDGAGGKMRASVVNIQSGETRVDSARTTINEKGMGTGNGGGAGSSPSFDQAIGTIFSGGRFGF